MDEIEIDALHAVVAALAALRRAAETCERAGYSDSNVIAPLRDAVLAVCEVAKTLEGKS